MSWTECYREIQICFWNSSAVWTLIYHDHQQRTVTSPRGMTQQNDQAILKSAIHRTVWAGDTGHRATHVTRRARNSAFASGRVLAESTNIQNSGSQCLGIPSIVRWSRNSATFFRLSHWDWSCQWLRQRNIQFTCYYWWVWHAVSRYTGTNLLRRRLDLTGGWRKLHVWWSSSWIVHVTKYDEGQESDLNASKGCSAPHFEWWQFCWLNRPQQEHWLM